MSQSTIDHITREALRTGLSMGEGTAFSVAALLFETALSLRVLEGAHLFPIASEPTRTRLFALLGVEVRALRVGARRSILARNLSKQLNSQTNEAKKRRTSVLFGCA